MPQMMPIAWLQMYILINMTLLLIVAKTHFMKTNKPLSSSLISYTKKNMTWLW